MNGLRECLRLPRWLQPEIARVDSGLVGAVGTPCVRFAIDEIDVEVWHSLTVSVRDSALTRISCVA